MSHRSELQFNLAKLVIAVAWVDGGLDHEEVNALKDLAFSLTELSESEWAKLEIYIDSPVGDEERQALLDNVLDLVQSSSDKEFVLVTLEELLSADQIITKEEELVFKELRDAILEKKNGWFQHVFDEY